MTTPFLRTSLHLPKASSLRQPGGDSPSHRKPTLQRKALQPNQMARLLKTYRMKINSSCSSTWIALVSCGLMLKLSNNTRSLFPPSMLTSLATQPVPRRKRRQSNSRGRPQHIAFHLTYYDIILTDVGSLQQSPAYMQEVLKIGLLSTIE
jgi:hypothetical protein